jgi:hypothetical protein
LASLIQSRIDSVITWINLMKTSDLVVELAFVAITIVVAGVALQFVGLPDEVKLLIGIGLFMFAVALPVILIQNFVVQQRWKTLASQLSLDYVPGLFNQTASGGIPVAFGSLGIFHQTQPQLVGQYRDRPVAIGVTAANANGVVRDRLSPLIDPPDRIPNGVATLRVAVGVRMPSQAYLLCSKKMALTGGALVADAQQYNIPEFETGDRPFDKKYQVRMQPVQWAAGILMDPSVRSRLMDWKPKKVEMGGRPFALEVCKGHVLYEEHRPSQTFSVQGVVEALELVMSVADVVETTP